MLSCPGLAILLIHLTTSCALSVPPCICSALQPAGLHVNCSSLGLKEVPPLPAHTTELYFQDNRLTSVPPGLFERLPGLKRARLSGNPFHCDCGIRYLRTWLLKNRAAVSGMPTCSSPKDVAHTAITALSDAHFSCGRKSCTGGSYDILLGTMLCGLIVLLVWGLRLAKHSTFTLDIGERHKGFEASSLHSLKPKHRRRLQHKLPEDSGNSASLTWTDDVERPLLSMELLPQIQGVLPKKHNMKFKET
ncbi:platelet glycoprotein IX [Aplochiton taeniatus]